MTEQQAIAYIDSIMSNYDRSVIEVSKLNPCYRHIDLWLGDKDMIALEMAKEALREKKDQITYGDKIRQMNNKELARLIFAIHEADDGEEKYFGKTEFSNFGLVYEEDDLAELLGEEIQ